MRMRRVMAVAGVCGAISSLALAQHDPLLRIDASVLLDDCLSPDHRPSCSAWSAAEEEPLLSASAALLPPEPDLPPRRQFPWLEYEPARHPGWDEELSYRDRRGGPDS